MRQFILLLIFLFSILSSVEAAAEESFVYDDKGKRDPFAPLVDENGRYLLETGLIYSFDELKLFGILWDPEGKSSCLINDQIIKVGESISGFVVQDITKDSVIIYKDGREYIMRLSFEEEKK